MSNTIAAFAATLDPKSSPRRSPMVRITWVLPEHNGPYQPLGGFFERIILLLRQLQAGLAAQV